MDACGISQTFGLPATWIDAALKEEAAIKGYTVVDAATVMSTHLTELIKSNLSEMLSYLAEHVRARLSHQLCAQYTTPGGHLPIVALTARWEQNFAESIVGQGDSARSSGPDAGAVAGGDLPARAAEDGGTYLIWN